MIFIRLDFNNLYYSKISPTAPNCFLRLCIISYAYGGGTFCARKTRFYGWRLRHSFCQCQTICFDNLAVERNDYRRINWFCLKEIEYFERKAQFPGRANEFNPLVKHLLHQNERNYRQMRISSMYHVVVEPTNLKEY